MKGKVALGVLIGLVLVYFTVVSILRHREGLRQLQGPWQGVVCAAQQANCN